AHGNEKAEGGDGDHDGGHEEDFRSGHVTTPVDEPLRYEIEAQVDEEAADHGHGEEGEKRAPDDDRHQAHGTDYDGDRPAADTDPVAECRDPQRVIRRRHGTDGAGHVCHSHRTQLPVEIGVLATDHLQGVDV